MKNIIENIKLVVTMSLIGLTLLYIGSTIFMPELTIKFFGFQPFVVQTESMEPEIMVNDMLIATKFNVDDAEVGDIITFYADIDYNGTEEVVTHYIYSIDTSGEETIIRTNRYFEEGVEITPDTWLIPASDVIGSYSFHIQHFGLLVGFLKSFYGMAVVGINIVLFTAIKIVSNHRKNSESPTLETLKNNQINSQNQMTV